MSLLDTFERRTLFVITRFLALFFIFVAILVLVGAFIWGEKLIGQGEPSTVRADEVISALKPSLQPEDQPQVPQSEQGEKQPVSPLIGYKIPFSLQRYVSNPKVAEIIAGRLNEVDPSRRDEYLKELDAAVQAAVIQHLEPYDAMDAYHPIKIEKLRAEREHKEESNTLRMYLVGGIASTVLFISIVSLILVLLAIERNTRPKET